MSWPFLSVTTSFIRCCYDDLLSISRLNLYDASLLISPRVSAVTFIPLPPSLRSRLCQDFGLHVTLHAHPPCAASDDFCASVQNFAIRFFQPSRRREHLADLLTVPSCGPVRDFHPIVIAHAAHTMEGSPRASFLFLRLLYAYNTAGVFCPIRNYGDFFSDFFHDTYFWQSPVATCEKP